MKCVRCGSVAVVVRGDEWFCGHCALARDWEEIIAIAQEGVANNGRAASAAAIPPLQATA